MTTPIRSRKPTGAVPWPLILIEGAEKAGKSWAAAELSASGRVGQTYWIDLSEGGADEYGAVPGARYEVIEHNGTWADFTGQVLAVRAEAARAAAAGEPPVVLVIDSMTAEWELLKGMADAKARARLARKGKQLAADEEPKITTDLWNEVNSKHRKLMTSLMTFPGIVVMTARGKEVASLDAAGRPIEGSKEYKVEGQKGLPFDASVWLRVSREHPPLVIGARSVHAGVRPGVDRPRPAPDLTLERVVFDILRCDPRTAHVRDLVELSTAAEEPAAEARPAPDPNALRDWALRPGRPAEEIAKYHGRLVSEHPAVAEHLVPNERGEREQLGALLERLVRRAADEAQRQRMLALLAEAEITDRHERLAYVADAIGRSVTSADELTTDEIAAVCTRVAAYIEQSNPEGMAA
ncbi:hypothetical protein J2S43_007885 [Catenuloplanes nepalensis]|uniref:AAA domain-containing protein n=1 Tax=Catenuloplanes nepalensis TaxID=587533 RepID=A0ABT9N6P9_9ACTN|nr:AAA family ATPase [Catenuloplanes nepalensis]MDP9799373.1 hypothetical protein [Catenuloplanes nepalensis]